METGPAGSTHDHRAGIAGSAAPAGARDSLALSRHAALAGTARGTGALRRAGTVVARSADPAAGGRAGRAPQYIRILLCASRHSASGDEDFDSSGDRRPATAARSARLASGLLRVRATPGSAAFRIRSAWGADPCRARRAVD